MGKGAFLTYILKLVKSLKKTMERILFPMVVSIHKKFRRNNQTIQHV